MWVQRRDRLILTWGIWGDYLELHYSHWNNREDGGSPNEEYKEYHMGEEDNKFSLVYFGLK